MKKELKIYLFRHGQTTFNRDGRFTGHLNPRLTKKGISQAKGIALKLKNKEIGLAVHSSLIRSKETLKEVLIFHPECKTIIEDDRIIERNYGKLNGTTHAEFINKIGKKIYDLEVHGNIISSLDRKGRKEAEKFLGEQEYNLLHRGYYVPPPAGESFSMVEKRVKSFIKYLIKTVKSKKCNVAISAHGNSIRLFRKIMENASIEETISWTIPYDKYFEYKINVK